MYVYIYIYVYIGFYLLPRLYVNIFCPANLYVKNSHTPIAQMEYQNQQCHLQTVWVTLIPASTASAIAWPWPTSIISCD